MGPTRLSEVTINIRSDWDLGKPGLREAWDRGDLSAFWPCGGSMRGVRQERLVGQVVSSNVGARAEDVYQPGDRPTLGRAWLRRSFGLGRPGCVLVTGQVERKTDFEPGFPVQYRRRGHSWEPDYMVWDDQGHIDDSRMAATGHQAGSMPLGIQKKMGTGTGWVLKSAIEPFRHYVLWLLSGVVRILRSWVEADCKPGSVSLAGR